MFKRFLVGFGVSIAIGFLQLSMLVSIMAVFVFPEYAYIWVGIAVVSLGSCYGLVAAFFPTLFKKRRIG